MYTMFNRQPMQGRQNQA